MRQLLKDLGVSAEALKLLKASEIPSLARLCAGGHTASSLIISMVNEVAKTTTDSLNPLLNAIAAYKGTWPILQSFLTQIGTRNPFLATNKSVIQVLPATDEGAVRGVSGHILTGIKYCAFDPMTPSSTVGYLSGKQAITSIFEAFCPERYNADTRQRVNTRRNRAITEELRNVSLESLTLGDLENNPAIADGIKSPLIARNLLVYRELRNAIEQYRSNLASQVYGANVVLPAINSLRVAHDPGRQLWGWFEDHLKENPNVPQGIRIAFASVRNPDIALSPEEERHYIQGLLAYQRLNSFINKSVALHGLTSDLDAYEKLPQEDSLRLNRNIELARLAVQRTIVESPTELTITEFSTMLENAAMVDFRREMNNRVLARYADEFQAALQHFDFVSFENGAWRDDARSDSVPMDRLKKHIYGARIGVVKPADSDDRKRGLLGQSDFKHIMDAQFLTRLVPDREKLLNAKPISEFKEMVEGVIVAYRKARFLDAELANFRNTPAGEAISLNPHDIGDVLSLWKPVLPMGTKYRPAEVWALETSGPKPTVTDLGEIAQRLRDGQNEVFTTRNKKHVSTLKEEYNKSRLAVDRYAGAGLYLPEMDSFWRSVEGRVRDFTPTRELGELMESATKMVVHPMMLAFRGYVAPEHDIPRMLTRSFLPPRAVETLRQFVEIRGDVERGSAGFTSADLSLLRQEIDALGLQNAILFHGGITTAGAHPTLSIEKTTFEAIAKPKRHPNMPWVVYYEPGVDRHDKPSRTLEQKVKEIKETTVPLSELGERWCARVRKLCSVQGKAALQMANLGLVDTPTFRHAQSFYASPSIRITREFVALLDTLKLG